jgi:hypothetical protein
MARKLSKYIDAIKQHAVVDAWNPVSSTITPLSYCEYVNSPTFAAATFAASTSYPLWTAPNDQTTWQIIAVSARYTAAAGSAATFQVEVAGAAVAPGSGTAQNSTGIALNGTANTTVNGVLTTQTVISAGTSINLVVGSTATTSLVGCNITVVLQRLT